MNAKDLSPLFKGILEQMLYSEIFRHPLTREELLCYLPCRVEHEPLLDEALKYLLNQELIGSRDGYYFVFEHEDKIDRRQRGEKKANTLNEKAHKIARFIHKFPFVEGVGISGSLSKGVLHADSDFDFFIITRPERLWVARTILVMYKKVFLLNSREFFCVNYFVDSKNLEIEEQNRFTAMEISSLIPVAGREMNAFFSENSWVENYYPNKKRNFEQAMTGKKPLWSRSLVRVFKGRFGQWSDKKMMRLTLKRWGKKFGDFDQSKFDLTMKSRPYVSKHHPNDFQNKVLREHEKQIERFKERYSTILTQIDLKL